tara:strand:+ start:2668 stop:4044 length:1377 start_codon:yes stop_codon:yes gene_type:complete
MQTIINPLVVSVGPTSEATITPVPMTHHGGGVKKVIAVVAAIAIPIAAPVIASSIAASGVLGAAVSTAMASTAGAVVSSAIVGAGLGAITAKVTGGNVKAGAISGLIGGGIGGYTAAAKPGMFGNPAAQPTTTATSSGLPQVQNASLNTTTGGTTGTTLSNTSGAQLQNASFAGAKNVADAGVTLSNQTSNVSFVDSMKAGLSDAGGKVLDRLTNPETLANAALQVGGAIAAEAIVGTPPAQTAEEAAAIEQYKAELETLKQRDEAAFNQKLDAAKQYMVQAGYYDPNYFGLQSANRAAIAEGRKLREFERKAGLTMGGTSAGERRRAALAGGANVQSAFDRGFLSGVDLQNRAMSTGVGLIPNAPTSGATGAYNLAALAQNQGNAERSAADAKKSNIQKFFGSFATQTGLTDAEKKKRAQLSGGLDTSGIDNALGKKDDPFVIDPNKKKDEPMQQYI